jgi:hypothetical protein
VKPKHGWEYYYYGNVQGQGDARGWYTFDHRPRFNNNYIGLRNRIAPAERGVLVRDVRRPHPGDEVLRRGGAGYAHGHAGASGRRGRGGRGVDRRPDDGVRAATERSAAQVEILMGDVVEERNPYSGATMLRRTDARRPERMWEYGTFRATESARVAGHLPRARRPRTPVLDNLAATA